MRLARGHRPAWIAIGLLLLLPAHSQLQSRTGPLTLTAPHGDRLDVTGALISEMSHAGQLRVTRVTIDPLAPASVHRRLEQRHRGVRILGADVTEQSASGRIVSVFGRLHRDLALDVTPTLLIGDAGGRVDRPDARVVGEPELVIMFDEQLGLHRLAYQVTTFGPGGLVAWLVDAHTGAVTGSTMRLTTQLETVCTDCAIGQGRGVKGDLKKVSVRTKTDGFAASDRIRPSHISTYNLQGDWIRALDVLTGMTALSDVDLASDADNTWTDGASVDAHAGAGWTTDYLYHRFGRRGLTDNDSPITIMTHPILREDFFNVPVAVAALFHVNAFYCGPCVPGGIAVFGEGLPAGLSIGSTGQRIDFFAAGLDIVGHELGHAVIDFSSKLVYQNESGALSEAFSDLLGVGLEFFVDESGRHRSEESDYLMGEDVLIPGGIRALDNPLSLGDPDHYSLRFKGTADNGGVHTNSTIATHAFYLAVEGGTNVTSGIQVTGVGRGQRALIEQIFYRAFAFLLPADATFSMTRAATIQSVQDLGGSAAVEQAITAAWTAVGVE